MFYVSLQHFCDSAPPNEVVPPQGAECEYSQQLDRQNAHRLY